MKRINLSHWNYFLALESDLSNISRFIEFSPANFETFSIELTRLFLASASEVDVIAKELCKLVAPAQPAKDIVQYRKILKVHFVNIALISVDIPRYELSFTPWNEWEKDVTPQWWLDYNKIKHDRLSSFALANLENALDSMAGLFILLMLFYRQQSQKIRLDPVPILFTAPRELVMRDLFLGGHISLHFGDDE